MKSRLFVFEGIVVEYCNTQEYKSIACRQLLSLESWAINTQFAFCRVTKSWITWRVHIVSDGRYIYVEIILHYKLFLNGARFIMQLVLKKLEPCGSTSKK